MTRSFIYAAMVFSSLNFAVHAQEFERGVSLTLAKQRKANIANVQYQLEMKLQKTDAIEAQVQIRFDLNAADAPLVFDFNAPAENIVEVMLNKRATKHRIESGHIVIPKSELAVGQQSVDIRFIAGDQSLNRKEEFLYTLLVPDRASTVFPCFDQPDMKATFVLTLDLPQGWIASANSPVAKEEKIGERTKIQYRPTQPISTYLFAFAAGDFKKITRDVGGRTMTLIHRESDEETVTRNVDDIFKTHQMSLDWMENYTGIDYPFEKFDFVLIPSFQYGGMEHTGNIFYNADQLFLPKTSTKNQKLNRASLIAHETAHMWFGNLVTMKWFDDVWLKEVFANFMAAKIVHPSFPSINHDLGFMLKHHPSAYGEDRSRGTYPIQQKLDNLQNAGTLYGRIIYMKAPIVMRQLETMIGQRQLQEGLQEYLQKFRFDNAVWDDLIEILDRKTETDLASWSETWVKEPGTPEVESQLKGDVLAIKQTRTTPKEKYWSQQIDIKVIANGKTINVRAMIDGPNTEVPVPVAREDYDFYLTNGSELGYGYFRLDEKSKNYLLAHVHEIEDDVTRGAAWLALYESLIRGEVPATNFLESLVRGIKTEKEPLNRQNILSQLSTVFWRFLSPQQRVEYANSIEPALWNWIKSEATDDDAKSSYYKSLVAIATTESTIEQLRSVWEKGTEVYGLELSEIDLMTLTYELAIRNRENSTSLLEKQFGRLKNEDRQKRFTYVMPVFSADDEIRDTFFESLREVKNRRPERWTLEALNYLHHPLHADGSRKYILPSLELLEEIQLTGDIFFPKRWLVATMGGHRTPDAAKIVTDFLTQRPDYSPRLKNKILQAADLLLRIGNGKTK